MQLLEPIEIAGRTVRNRIVFGPHPTNLARGRAISEHHLAYYRRRAVGGTGMLITEEASVHALDWPYERAPLAADCGAGWAAVAGAVHEEGALVLAGIGHAGLQGSSAYSQRELWAPSRRADAVSRELSKEMEPTDIAEVLDGFAAAAGLAMGAGCDGVELNAGQHSLIRQFLSGLTNDRADEWGPGQSGSGRLRFATETIRRVRSAVGEGIVGLRLSCDEYAPWAGLTPESATEVAAALAPLVDYVAVVAGSIFTADVSRPDAHVPAGFNLDLAGRVRVGIGAQVPVMAQGSIVEWGQAEWALTDGRADLVEMTRAQIADPDLAERLGAGESHRIRPCLRCNQRCMVRDSRNPIVTCVVNPTAGYEAEEAEAAAPTAQPQRVVVVGAGPAGMELARVAATAGHDVEVHDARSHTGAAVRHWARASGRESLAPIAEWLEAECRELGVTIQLDSAVGAPEIDAWEAAGARVVLCTGSAPRRPEYMVHPGGVLMDVLEALDVLSGDGGELPTGRVVVWDPVGGPVGVSMAETLAAAGREVALVTPDQIPGTLLSLTGDLASANTRLLQAGVALVKSSVLRSVDAGACVVENRFTGEREALAATVVIDAGHRLPADDLWHETGERLEMAGDAVAPRTLYEAILEGRRIAVGLPA